MRVGMTFFCQNAEDWDRYESEERGEPAASRPSTSDRQIFLEEVERAKSADALGFDTVWTVGKVRPPTFALVDTVGTQGILVNFAAPKK